jgi:WD40 repeat protein
VAVTPDGRRAVSASADCTLRLWDLESGQTVRTFQGHTSFVSAVAVTPDGRRAVSASWDRTLRLWDLESGQTIRTLQVYTERATAVAMTADGRRAVFNGTNKTLRVLELESGEEIATFTGESKMFHFALTPDGRTICGRRRIRPSAFSVAHRSRPNKAFAQRNKNPAPVSGEACN